MKKFTLVEIVFAVAVVAISIVAVMPLLAVGMRSSKDAISDTYAAGSAELFLNVMAMRCLSDWAGEIGISDTTGKIRSEKPGDSAEDEMHLWIPLPESGLYRMPFRDDVYGARQRSGSAVDFSGVIRVWKSRVVSQSYSGSGWVDVEDSGYSRSAGLNIELSWPAEQNYSSREKRLFYMEVYRQ